MFTRIYFLLGQFDIKVNYYYTYCSSPIHCEFPMKFQDFAEFLDSSSLHFNHYQMSYTRFQICLGTDKVKSLQEPSSSEEKDAFEVLC